MSRLQAKNEAIINAPASEIWALITDINQFHKINPGLISAIGTMDTLNGIRQCVINNKGKKGNITEKLIELVPEKRTVWTIVADDMGWSKMLKNTRFCLILEKLEGNKTKVTNETWYAPTGLFAKIMNSLMMKRIIYRAQEKILANIISLTEK